MTGSISNRICLVSRTIHRALVNTAHAYSKIHSVGKEVVSLDTSLHICETGMKRKVRLNGYSCSELSNHNDLQLTICIVPF